MMYLFFFLCRKMKEKKFMKIPQINTARLESLTAPVDGHNYTNAYGTASFPSEGKRNLILIVDSAISTIF